jgi:hypothetical protein
MFEQLNDILRYNGKTYQLPSATLADQLSDAAERSSPLAPLLETNDMMQYFTSPYLPFYSSNIRGYTCHWKIEDNQLFLLSFISRSTMLYSIDQLLGKSLPAISSVSEAKSQRFKEIETEFEQQYGSIKDIEENMQKLHDSLDDSEKKFVSKGTKTAYKDMKDECFTLLILSGEYEEKATLFAEWFSGSVELKEFKEYAAKTDSLHIKISKGLVIGSTICRAPLS